MANCYIHYKNNADRNAYFNRLINSLFTKLPGDDEKFHKMAEKLDNLPKDQESKDNIQKLEATAQTLSPPLPNSKINKNTNQKIPIEKLFIPTRNIKLLDCQKFGPIDKYDKQFSGRTFYGSDNNIYLCGDKLWQHFVKNERTVIQNLLLHEMVHFYDKNVKKLNFYNSRDLACSEIRAFHLASKYTSLESLAPDSFNSTFTVTLPESFINNDLFDSVEDSLRNTTSTKYLSASERVDVIASTLENCVKDQSPFNDNFQYENFRQEMLRKSEQERKLLVKNGKSSITIKSKKQL